MLKIHNIIRVSGIAPILFTMQVLAAPPLPVDAGKVLRDSQPAQPAKPSKQKEIKAPAAQKQNVNSADVTVDVKKITYSGNSALSNEQLDNTTAQWRGRALNFGDLIQMTDAIEAAYHKQGYFLAQATLPPQKIINGVINVVVSEGKLGKVRLEGESRISSDVLYGFLDKLPKDQPLTEAKLERQALLITDLIGGRANVDLQAGEDAGTTDVVLSQTADQLFTGRADIDNYGFPSTGEYRLGLSGSVNSPFHRGDLLSGNFITTNTGNLQAYGLRYDTPIGGDGWHVNLSKTLALYSLGGNFANLNADGRADSWRLGTSYPMLRSRKASLWFKLEGDYSKLTNKIGISNLNLDSKVRGLTFNPTGDWTDSFGGGGSNYLSLALRAGNLKLDSQGKALDLPPGGLNTDGNFSKVLVDIQRTQTITNNVALQGLWRHQLASKNLDSSEKLSVGGYGNMVAYPNSQANFDEGGMGKIHLMWYPMNNLRLGTFAEYANVRLSKNPLAGSDNKHHYADAGFSVDWKLDSGFDLSSTLAWAGRESANPVDNDKPRLWVKLGYEFGQSRTKIKSKNAFDTPEAVQ